MRDARRVGGTRGATGVTLVAIAVFSLMPGAPGPLNPAALAQTPPGAPASPPAPPEAFTNALGEVTADSVSATTLLVMPMSGSYGQLSDAIMKLIMYAAPRGIMRDMPLGVFYNSPAEVPVDSLRWDVCVPVSADAQAEPPYVIRQEPQRLAAVAICTGPFQGVGLCHGPLMEWIAAHGYRPSGPSQEHWLSDPSSVPPDKQETRIIVPIEPLPGK